MRGALRLGAITALAATLLLAAMATAEAQEQRATAVQAAARAWLASADKLDGAATWRLAGVRFRSDVTVEAWSAALRKARSNWGAVEQRASTVTGFRDVLPDGTKGEFAQVQYRTAFAHHSDGHESLTLEHEPDGVWRVIGYFVR